MLGRWASRRVLRGRHPDSRSLGIIQHHRYSSHQLHIPSKNIHGITRKRISIAPDVGQILTLQQGTRPRHFITDAVPNILVPPLIFTGLLISLWIWKCFWIVIMQDKLLYLSWLPPLTRSEKISDYERECGPVQWTEKQLRSLDGTRLAVCEGRIPIPQEVQISRTNVDVSSRVVICYFQGNGGSTPMRLPLLSQVLRTINETPPKSPTSALSATEYIIVALSYRGYWTSSGRATQSGIEMDAQAFLNWVSQTYGNPSSQTRVILWGHSLGSAVATAAAAAYLRRQQDQQESSTKNKIRQPLLPLAGLVLEAPTSSIKDMLISLYPQKWLPYRYLWPLSWNTWNIKQSMQQLADWRDEVEPGSRSLPPFLLLAAEKDEVIPAYVPGQLEDHARSLDLDIERKDVLGALHIEAPFKLEGRKALVNFIMRCSSNKEIVNVASSKADG